MRKLIILLVLLVVGTAACDIETPMPLPTLTATSTIIPTATTVWFPATITPTPFPTVVLTPTPDPQESLGSVILADDFSEPSAWSLVNTASSSSAIANQHLTLALSRPRVYLFTIRNQPYARNFYLEVTASPNFCSDGDEYGVMVRVTPDLDYYRLGLSCDGQARVDRLYRGAVSALIPWARNGAVPVGAPGSARIGVWVADDELRFYVNGFFLFALHDRAVGTGSVGLFVHQVGETAVSVNFSDLVIYSLLR